MDSYSEEKGLKKVQTHFVSTLFALFLTVSSLYVVVNPASTQPMGIPLPAIPSASRVPLNVTALYRQPKLNKKTTIIVIKQKKVAAALQAEINQDTFLKYLETKKEKLKEKKDQELENLAAATKI